MAYYIPLPRHPSRNSAAYINMIDGKSSMVQRALRREGLAGYEPSTMAALMALFEIQKPGFIYFDVGANIGLYSLLCDALFSPSEIVAFEPTPDTAAIARKITRVNSARTQLEQVALGDKAGVAQLFLSAVSDASNSLAEGFKESKGTIDVPVETMDDFVARRQVTPDIIKIDAETFEPQILAGGHKLITQHRPFILLEVLNRRGHDHGVDVEKEIEGLGYYRYPCTTYSDWDPVGIVRGDLGEERDWLLSPAPLPAGFMERVEWWETKLSACTENRNVRSISVPADKDKVRTGLASRARRTVSKIKRSMVS
jgi:FkbM family methyltransferase